MAGGSPAAARVSRNSAFSLSDPGLRDHRRGEPGVGQPGGALDRRLGIARHPDRRAARLLGLQARLHAAQRMEAAAMLDDIVAPQLADHLDALDEARHALLEGHADRIELLLAIAQPQADDGVAAAEPVERRGFLGDDDRIEQRQEQQARPQLHALGLGREPRQQRHGLEHLQRARHEMLPDHQRGEPARLRDADLLDQVLEFRSEVRALAPLRRHVESELHLRILDALTGSRAIIRVADNRWRDRPGPARHTSAPARGYERAASDWPAPGADPRRAA